MGQLIHDPEDDGIEQWWKEDDGYYFATLGERIGPFENWLGISEEENERTRHHVFDVLDRKRPRWLMLKATEDGPIVIGETCEPDQCSHWNMLKEEALADPDIGAAARAWVAGDDDAYYLDRWRFLAEWDAEQIIEAAGRAARPE